MSNLPPTWEPCRLGDVVEYGTTRKAEPSDIPDDAWVLELEDVEKDTSKVLQRVTFAQRQSKSTKNRFARGDVLYGKLRPYLNKVIRADQDGFSTTEIVPLVPSEWLDGGYLFHWLKHPTFLEYVTAVSHGLNMPRLGTEAGREAPFVLAPLNEQKRIVDKLDAVLARADACRERLDRVPTILKRFRQSVLAAATSGKLTEDWREKHREADAHIPFVESEAPTDALALPKNWRWISVGDLAVKVADGVHKKPNYVSEGIPFVTVKNLTAGPGIDFSETNFVTESDHQEFCRRTHPEIGDILISKDGTLGVVRIIETDLRFSIFVSVALIKLRDKRMGRYVSLALESSVLQKQMVGVGTGLQHIHLRDLRQDVVPLPPLAEQMEIVRRVEALFAYANRLEARYAAARAQVERLTPALLAKAFRGELVPQDPSDEPASELLERIRTARTATSYNPIKCKTAARIPARKMEAKC